MPIPPPMHKAAIPLRSPLASNACNKVTNILAPKKNYALTSE